MESSPPARADFRGTLDALAIRFDSLAELSNQRDAKNPGPDSLGSGSAWNPPIPTRDLLVEKAIRDQRKSCEQALTEAGELLVAVVNGRLLNDARAIAFVAAFELQEWGGLVSTPANLFALYAGGSRITLRSPDGRESQFETVGDGIPPNMRLITETGLRTATRRALGLVDAVPKEQCLHYAAICRKLAVSLPKTATTSEGETTGQSSAKLTKKEARREEVRKRYRQLAQETNGSGKPIYATQEHLVDKLVKELDVGRSTIMADIRELRNEGKLPPRPRMPKEESNRMSIVDPKRSVASD